MHQPPTRFGSLLLAGALGALLACASSCGDSVQGNTARGAQESRAAKATREDGARILAQLQQLGYASYVEDEDESRPSGALVHDAAAMAPGVNLLSIHRLCTAQLIDATGKVLHEWSHPGLTWGHAELLPDGSILAPLAEKGASCLVKIDWNNELVWRLPYSAHHDAEVLPDGRIAMLAFNYREIAAITSEIRVRDDQLLVLDSDGAQLEEYSIADLLGGSSEWTFEDVKPGKSFLDLLHSNSVAWMRPEHETLGPLFAAGNVLVSMRHQNRVVILRPATGELLWSWGADEMIGQHDATVLDNGNILIFDNGLGRGWSRALEVDPRTDAIVWEWRAPNPEDFYTIARGAAQRFENGNTLLVDSDHGHAFEVTRSGRIVWEYYQPGIDDRIATIVRMKRYPRAYLGDLLSAK